MLVVAESLAPVEDFVRRVLVLILLAGPVALAATALAGYWLARKALRPVERMTSNAREIGIDRLNERVAVPRAADELGRLAVTLNAMLDRLERGVREKHRLIADASHELRTPLAVMRAELDVSLRDADLADDAREVLESAREEVDRMSRTVDNLLTLAQVDEGRLELLTTRVSLREVIDGAVRPLRPLAEARGVRAARRRDRRRGAGRSAAPAPGGDEPGGERAEVHPTRRDGAGARLAHGRRGRVHGQRRRARDPCRTRAHTSSTASTGWTGRAPARSAAAASAWRSAGRSPSRTAATCGWRARRVGAARSRWRCRLTAR